MGGKPEKNSKYGPRTRNGYRAKAFELRLYVAGQTPRSLAAVANLRKICEGHLASRYRLEIIDLTLNPERARADEIVAIPTLVRRLPPPIKKVIGDLSDTGKVLIGLQMRPI